MLWGMNTTQYYTDIIDNLDLHPKKQKKKIREKLSFYFFEKCVFVFMNPKILVNIVFLFDYIFYTLKKP